MLLEIQQGNISEKLSNGEVRHLRKYGEVELLRKFADEILREIRQHVGEIIGEVVGVAVAEMKVGQFKQNVGIKINNAEEDEKNIQIIEKQLL